MIIWNFESLNHYNFGAILSASFIDFYVSAISAFYEIKWCFMNIARKPFFGPMSVLPTFYERRYE